MENGRNRSRPTASESVEDILARNGLTEPAAAPTGRAARRRAAEEQAEREAAPPVSGRRRRREIDDEPPPPGSGPARGRHDRPASYPDAPWTDEPPARGTRSTGGRAEPGAWPDRTGLDVTALHRPLPNGAPPDRRPNGSPPNGARPGGAHSGGTRSDAARPGGAFSDAARPNGAHPDGARPSAPRSNEARPSAAPPNNAPPNIARPNGARPDRGGSTGIPPNGFRPSGARPGNGRANSAPRNLPPGIGGAPNGSRSAEVRPTGVRPTEIRPAEIRPEETRRSAPRATPGTPPSGRETPRPPGAQAEPSPTNTPAPPTGRNRPVTPAPDAADAPTSVSRRARPPADDEPKGPGRASTDTSTRSAERAPTGLADIGTGTWDVSEQAERSRRADRAGDASARSSRIDETLVRLTAAHAGMALAARDGDDDPPEAPPRPGLLRRLPRPGPAKLVALAVALVVFGATAVGTGAQSWLGSAVRDVAALDPGSGAIVDADAQAGDENVLVVATDLGTAPGTATQQGSPAPRPDTVVVAHIPDGGGPVTVLSVPTDLEINRPPCERFDRDTAGYTGEVVPAEARTQLATALDAGGPRCATRVIQQLTGLAVTQYVGMDLDRMGALVDAASGVSVCVPRPLLDRVLGPVVPNAGTFTLDGARAGDFVRAADVDGDPPADQGRIERQQAVLAAVLDPTMSSTGLLDLPRVAALRPALGAALVSDGAGLDEILALALTLRGMGTDGLTFTTVPTTAGTNGRGNAVLRDADAAALFRALRADTALPESAGDTGSSDAGPVPADLKVEVINASTETGRAAKVGELLSSLGFGVGEVSNAAQSTPQTVIRFSPDQAAAADLLAATVPAATSVPDPGATGVLQLVLGRSFDDVIRAPTSGVAPAAATSDTATSPSATC